MLVLERVKSWGGVVRHAEAVASLGGRVKAQRNRLLRRMSITNTRRNLQRPSGDGISQTQETIADERSSASSALRVKPTGAVDLMR